MARRRTWLCMLLCLSGVLFRGSIILAVPPTDAVIAQLKSAGQLDSHVLAYNEARRRGLDQPNPHRVAAAGASDVTGNLNVLVLLVDFSDNPASGGTSTDTAFFNHLLFSTNVPGTSMNDHYQEMSYGLVTISGLTVNWLRMPQTYAYYVNGQRGFGNYPRNAQRLAEDAVDAAEAAGVDFSAFDNDDDGTMDGLFIVHAGPGYEETGDLNQIHSHAWSLGSSRFYDGVSISSYTMEPEEQASLQPVRVGVFSHEYGHFLGLPDLYDGDYSSSGIGRWCLMASGSWANGGTTPVHMSAWCKDQLGWNQVTDVNFNLQDVEVEQAETSRDAFQLERAGGGFAEYFLVENRQKTLFDTYLPGEGLLIWHINLNKSSNNNEWYPGLPTNLGYLVALEQSDGDYDLEHGNNSGDNADPWPGSENHIEFSDFTLPNSKFYNGTATQIAVWNISASDSAMTANLDIFYSQPYFSLEDTSFTDNGNANGRPDPGESVSMVASLRNLGALADNVEILVTTDEPLIGLTDSTAVVGSVGTGVVVSNAGDPFEFAVPANYIPRIVEFYVTVTSTTAGYARTDTLRVHIGPDQLLLVDDDARLSPLPSYDITQILPVLDSLRVPYSRWEVESQGTPSTMNSYPAVLWYTGDRRLDPVSGPDTTLTPSERSAIASYLDSGGHLWLTGQQVAYMLHQADSAFMHNYLHAVYGGPFTDFMARGIDGDVVGDQTLYVLGGAGGAGNQLAMDLVVPVNGALPAFTEEANRANITGVRFEGAYKVLFLGWGVEGIGDDIAYLFDAQPKSVLISRALDWLVYNAVFSGVSLYPLVVNPGSDPTHLVDTAIHLHWNFASPGSDPQDSLEVQVGSNSDWSVAEHWSPGPLASSDTTVHYAGTPVVAGQTYFWRVRVYSAGAWSSWANSSWHMNAAPAAPALYSPVANAVALQNGPILTTSNAVDPEGDAASYEFEVYSDSALATLLASTSGVPQNLPRTSWTVNVLLAEHSRAWWRARAFDGHFHGPWSGATPFYVDAINETPLPPALESPADSAVQFDNSINFHWSSALDPDLVDTLRYRVQVDTQSSFTSALEYDSLLADSLQVPGVLASGKRFHWRVTVFDKGGLEATSEVRSFLNLLMGDINRDGSFTVSDIVLLVNYVFKGGPPPDPVALGDANASCSVTSADIIYLVNYAFKSGPAPLTGCAGP